MLYSQSHNAPEHRLRCGEEKGQHVRAIIPEVNQWGADVRLADDKYGLNRWVHRCTRFFIVPHLATKVPLPELAVRSSTSHGPQQETIDLNDLLHCLGGCVRKHKAEHLLDD